MWFDPWVGKIPSWRRIWQPILVFLPGESHRQRSLVGCTPQSCKIGTQLKQLSMHVQHAAIQVYILVSLIYQQNIRYLWECELGLFINPSGIYCHFLKKKLRLLSPFMQSIEDVCISETNMMTNPCHLLKERRKITYAASGHKMLAQGFVLLNSTGHRKTIINDAIFSQR